jgi:hypothetical protein
MYTRVSSVCERKKERERVRERERTRAAVAVELVRDNHGENGLTTARMDFAIRVD